MIEEVLKITNRHGLHARPAAQFVKIAGKFVSEIKVIKDGLEVNGKSIMGAHHRRRRKRSICCIEGVDRSKIL